MDILVITWNFPPRRGGMEQLLASLCNGLSKNHRLFVITSYAGSSYERETGIFRPRWPGLFAFFSYALCKGALLLRCQRDISVVFGGSVLVTPMVAIPGANIPSKSDRASTRTRCCLFKVDLSVPLCSLVEVL